MRSSSLNPIPKRLASRLLAGFLTLLTAWTLGLAGPSLAQSTRSTRTTPLDGSGYTNGSLTPAPAFTLPSTVTVKKKLRVEQDPANNRTNLTQTCTFRNGSMQRVEFLFCDMVARSSAGPQVNESNACNIGFDAMTNTWKCFEDTSGSSQMASPSYHFGCVEVRLDKGKSFTPPAKTGMSGDMGGLEAKDFEVSYADIFDLTGKTFDSMSCASCFGANKALNFGTPPPGMGPRGSATGFWIMTNTPITDPYVNQQTTTGTVKPTQYCSLSSGLCMPQGFPFEIPGVSIAENTEPPVAYSMDVDLWDMYTMSAPPDVVTPVFLEVSYDDSTSAGVEIEVQPTYVEIAGGSMDYGSVTFRRPTSPEAPEGTVVPFSISFLDAQNPEQELWEQNGTLIQDRVPPVVRWHLESASENEVSVMIGTEDATTDPESANFWFSTDGGATWDVLALEEDAVPDVINPGDDATDADMAVVFSGKIRQKLRSGTVIDYVYNVQDSVYNQVWFGPGKLQVGKQAAKPFPQVSRATLQP